MKKIMDAQGYAYLLANVAQFGNEDVVVKNGPVVVFIGAANKFVEKYANRFKWTLCANVDGNEILF